MVACEVLWIVVQVLGGSARKKTYREKESWGVPFGALEDASRVCLEGERPRGRHRAISQTDRCLVRPRLGDEKGEPLPWLVSVRGLSPNHHARILAHALPHRLFDPLREVDNLVEGSGFRVEGLGFKV